MVGSSPVYPRRQHRSTARIRVASSRGENGDGIELGDGTTYAIREPEPALVARLGLDQPAIVLAPVTAG
jgi:hypothetical protein